MVLNFEEKGYHRTNRFLLRWKFWFFVTIPVILSPILIITYARMEARGVYTMLVVIFFWIFNVLPMGVTALLPMTLAPFLEIESSDLLAPTYMKEITMLILTSVIVAIAIEYSNLHRRTAIFILRYMGTSTRWLVLGFMLPSAFLSMWINNTSATAMMIPIADSLLREMYPFDIPDLLEPEMNVIVPKDEDLVRTARRTRQLIMLCIAHGSNIGGTATLTGTLPNLLLVALLEEEFGPNAININYFTWLLFNLPNAIFCVLVGWILLQIIFLGFKATFKRQAQDPSLKAVINEKYNELGSITYHEITVLILFYALILLWMLRSPGFMPGWTNLFGHKKQIKDSAASTLIVVLLFSLPSVPDLWFKDVDNRDRDDPPPRCLIWKLIHARMPWGVILLFGGGFALTEISRLSGLARLINDSMMYFKDVSTFSLTIVVCLITFILTSFTSNTATAAILFPVLISVADGMRIAPLWILMPAVITCSLAFLLPISTPPNAMIFERAKLPMGKMAFAGLIQGMVCLTISIAMVNVWAPVIFDMDQHPHYRNPPG